MVRFEESSKKVLILEEFKTKVSRIHLQNSYMRVHVPIYVYKNRITHTDTYI